MVCFRVAPSAIFDGNEPVELCSVEDVNELNTKLLESVNGSGWACMTHAVLGEVYHIRFTIGATLTDYRHVNVAWKVVQEHASALLRTPNIY